MTMPNLSQRLNERTQKSLEQHYAEEAYVVEHLAQLDMAGPDCLARLAKVAQGDTGQSRHCRRVLLAVYNSDVWPLALNRLRCLDRSLQFDALTVIEWSAYASRELHEYLFDDGDQLMLRLWDIETGKES